MRERYRKPAGLQPKQPGLADRMLMAIVAPIVFNISIVIVIAMFFRRSRYLARYLLYPTEISGGLVFLAACVLPAIAGFLMGASRFATLLGHFFYTNMDHEKDIAKTTAAWAGLILLAYLLSQN
jgi:hypothetical protein